ncbi:MAG: hypothetical protein LH478_10370 [Chitinophagaceae bacterium]|nr:hypothetical protein [Chitinophagaceae bacterium]
MYTTYHLTSAQELSTEILESIKATYKTKPITIIVEEDNSYPALTNEEQQILEERLKEDENTYLTAGESISQLKNKYGI